MSEETKSVSTKTGGKVKTAIFGNDLFVEIKDYPISKAGNKIDIVNTGAGYFMPEIGPNKFLYWPIRKKYLFFGAWVYTRIFFAMKRGKSCIDFSLDDPKAYGPDIEQIDSALGNNLASQVGSGVETKTPWYIWFILVLNIIVFILVLQIAGVIR